MNKNRVLANVKVDYQELKAQVNFGLVMIKGLIAEYNGQKNYGCVLRLAEMLEEVKSKIDAIHVLESVEELDDLIMVMEMMTEMYETMKYYLEM